MNSIELIRSGIRLGDWERVCNGYAMMTGEELDVPAADGNPLVDTLNSIIAEATRALSTVQKAAVPEAEERKKGRHAAQEREEKRGKRRAKKRAATPAQTEDVISIPVVAARQENKPATPADPFAQFRTQPAQPKREDGKADCRAEPFVPGMVNKFKDDRTEAREELELDKKMSGKMVPRPRRETVGHVDVKCSKCGTGESVPPVQAPRGGGEEGSASYVCNGCIKGRRRG